jgi:endonuclease/exonuclease/phosphatase family metal-dependent hydrolase
MRHLTGLGLVALFATSAPAASAVRVRVLTYNIHHGEGTDGRFDLDRVAELIRNAQPDLIALQEVDRGTVRSGGVDQLAQLERLTGLHGAFGKTMDFQDGSYGVAVLSRARIEDVESHPLPGAPDREPRTALSVTVHVAEGLPVRFISTHLDQGRDIESRSSQARFLAAQLADDDQPAILAGDFNSTADNEVMQLLGPAWTGMFNAPEPIGPQGVPRRRVDHVLVRPAGRWQPLEAGVIDDRLASDHRPVFATLELR